MSDPLKFVVGLVHVLAGISWAGASILLVAFIGPAVTHLGADGGKLMQRLMGPGRMGVFMVGVGVATVLSGVLLFQLGAEAQGGRWTSSTYGIAIIIGASFGMAAFVLGLAVNAPTASRIARLSGALAQSGGPPAPPQVATIERLRKRLEMGSAITTVLLVVSAAAMGTAVFL